MWRWITGILGHGRSMALASIATLAVALWLHSFFAYVGVNVDLAFTHLHFASYQGRLGIVIGDDADLPAGHILSDGRPPLSPPPLTQFGRAFSDLTIASYGAGFRDELHLPSASAPVTVTGFVMPHLIIPLICLGAGGVLCLVIVRHRANRGRCIGCGYDLRGTHGSCPECGQHG